MVVLAEVAGIAALAVSLTNQRGGAAGAMATVLAGTRVAFAVVVVACLAAGFGGIVLARRGQLFAGAAVIAAAAILLPPAVCTLGLGFQNPAIEPNPYPTRRLTLPPDHAPPGEHRVCLKDPSDPSEPYCTYQPDEPHRGGPAAHATPVHVTPNFNYSGPSSLPSLRHPTPIP